MLEQLPNVFRVVILSSSVVWMSLCIFSPAPSPAQNYSALNLTPDFHVVGGIAAQVTGGNGMPLSPITWSGAPIDFSSIPIEYKRGIEKVGATEAAYAGARVYVHAGNVIMKVVPKQDSDGFVYGQFVYGQYNRTNRVWRLALPMIVQRECTLNSSLIPLQFWGEPAKRFSSQAVTICS